MWLWHKVGRCTAKIAMYMYRHCTDFITQSLISLERRLRIATYVFNKGSPCQYEWQTTGLAFCYSIEIEVEYVLKN